MRKNLFKVGLALSFAVGLVTACGGGDSAVADPRTTFTTAFASGLASLTTSAGLQGTAFLDLVDSTFLDGGYNKAQMADNLAKDSASLSAATAVSLFPGVTITNPQVTCEGAATVCTFSGTISNADVDTTETTFTTPVIFNNGAYRLRGDQASS